MEWETVHVTLRLFIVTHESHLNSLVSGFIWIFVLRERETAVVLTSFLSQQGKSDFYNCSVLIWIHSELWSHYQDLFKTSPVRRFWPWRVSEAFRADLRICVWCSQQLLWGQLSLVTVSDEQRTWSETSRITPDCGTTKHKNAERLLLGLVYSVYKNNRNPCIDPI